MFEVFNDYSTADHFVTRVRNTTRDMTLGVRITDEVETEIVRSSDRAFLVWMGPRRWRITYPKRARWVSLA